MKNLFLTILAILLIPAMAFADHSGTVVSAPVTVGSSNNTFGSAYNDEIIGSPKTVDDLTARDAIPAARRVIGMTCYVVADSKTYRLVGGITNGDWQEISTSVAGGWTDGGINIYPTSSTDNIGIGTTMPVAKLEVIGTLKATSFDSGVGIGDFRSTAGMNFNSNSGADLNPDMVILPNGNVAIGTNTPTNRLTVSGAMNATGTITASNFSGSSSGANTGDQDLSGLLVKANNLSDLSSVSTARTNLGLGTLATQNGTFSGTSSGTNTGDQTNIAGNAGTASALFANGGNCPTGQSPLGVDATGSSENCFDVATQSEVDNLATAAGWTDSGATVNPTTSMDAVGIGTTSAIGRMTIKGQNAHYLGCGDSIQTAVTNATAGDIIRLGACTYNLTSTVTSTKSVSIVGEGLNSTIISVGSESGAFSYSGSGLTNVLLADFSIVGSDSATAIAISDGNGSANDPDNIIIKNVNIDVKSDGGASGIIFLNSSGYVEDSYIHITNTDGSTGGEQVRGISLFTNGSAVGGATPNSEANENHTLIVRNTTVISEDTSGSWNGGRMRGFFGWMNAGDPTQYNSTTHIYNSSFISKLASPTGGANYGTEAVGYQGPNTAYNPGVVGLVSLYIKDSYLDGGEVNDSQGAGARDLRCDDYAECHLESTTLRRQDIQNQNSAVIYRKGIINAGGLYSINEEKASAFTAGAYGIYAVGQLAGNDWQSGARTGYVGGRNYIKGGTGGMATAIDAAKTGGPGGNNQIIGGDGGSQTNAAPTNNGGVGGYVSLIGGLGGSSSGGTVNNGGNGGPIYLRGGIAGTGASANGTDGNIFLGVDSGGLLSGKVGIGTATVPGSKISIFGGASIGNSSYAQTASPTNGLIVSGNVGFGTTTPTDSLQVLGGSIRAAGYKSSDGTAGVTGSTCTAWKNGLCTSL